MVTLRDMKHSKGLRRGFTTGTTAAAAAKGAALHMLTGRVPEKISVTLPDNSSIDVPLITKNSLIGAIKDSGDDPDVTNGIIICAKIKIISAQGDIILKGGKGVGRVTKPGLQIPIGSPAINPVPQRMIRDNVRQIDPKRGLEIEIIIPEGEKVAQKTFNEKVGVVGGLSIVGTTGIVEPMSLEAIKETIRCEINVAAASGFKKIGLVPGKIGEKALKQIIPSYIPVIQMSNFVGFALETSFNKDIKEIIIGGHPGKLAKIAMGFMDTHSRCSPQANHYIEELFSLKENFNTVEEIILKISEEDKRQKFSLLAQKISEKISHLYAFTSISVFLFDMKKNLVACCEQKWK
jgi:cobalt-precorrin-5B (C1)-methyltransferase